MIQFFFALSATVVRQAYSRLRSANVQPSLPSRMPGTLANDRRLSLLLAARVIGQVSRFFLRCCRDWFSGFTWRA